MIRIRHGKKSTKNIVTRTTHGGCNWTGKDLCTAKNKHDKDWACKELNYVQQN